MGVRFFSLVRSFAALPIPRPIGSLFTALGDCFFLVHRCSYSLFSSAPCAPLKVQFNFREKSTLLKDDVQNSLPERLFPRTSTVKVATKRSLCGRLGPRRSRRDRLFSSSTHAGAGKLSDRANVSRGWMRGGRYCSR